MSLLRNLFFLFSITLFGVAGTILALFNYNPYDSGINVFFYFYISLIIALTGIISIAIFYAKTRLYQTNSSHIRLFWPSIRQGFLVSLCVVVIMLLKGMKLLDYWVGIPIIFAITLLELFFQTNRKTKAKG